MKMIGVCSQRGRVRMSAAVSKPSMIGMLTSSRMTAKSPWRSARSASFPEPTFTTFWPSSARIASSATSLSGWSSTTRMSTRSFRTDLLLRQPEPEGGKQPLGVDRLREVVRGAGLDAFLPVALHRLGGQRDERQGLEWLQRTDRPHGVVAVQLGQHDVTEHDPHVGHGPEYADRLAPVLGRQHLHPVALEEARHGEDVADVVVHDQDLAAAQRAVSVVPA